LPIEEEEEEEEEEEIVHTAIQSRIIQGRWCMFKFVWMFVTVASYCK
jgi:hypothetical protein